MYVNDPIYSLDLNNVEDLKLIKKIINCFFKTIWTWEDNFFLSTIA